ncbi:hypothetical protein [Guptibacillus algicola]|uniref:hypothetical protein n=1 Tax=Guptibacillus algicola TaxID=225844 RepID=UPI001CD7330D|nr:hypothetical protein [Alkalihalobacillus algicola]MCA0987372.1 hypothetical protein [Alkalihalobacillus algicola]
MFRKVFQVSQLAFLRFLTRLMLKKKIYKEPTNIMKNFQMRFVNKGYLNEDLTKGAESAPYSIIQELVHSFVSLRQFRNEEDFYIQVAKNWVNDLYSSNHKISLLFLILYVALIGTVFLNQYVEVISGGLWLIGIFLSPIIGFIIALGGKGWKRLGLVFTHLFLLTYSIIVIV